MNSLDVPWERKVTGPYELRDNRNIQRHIN